MSWTSKTLFFVFLSILVFSPVIKPISAEASDKLVKDYDLVFCEKRNNTLYAFKKLRYNPVKKKKHPLCLASHVNYQKGTVEGYVNSTGGYWKSGKGEFWVICAPELMLLDIGGVSNQPDCDTDSGLKF